MNKSVLIVVVAVLLSGCVTSQGGTTGGIKSLQVRETSQSNGVWRLPTNKAADDALRPITEACSVNGATELQIGACAHAKLLAAWPDVQPGAKECAGLVGSRPTAACLLDFGYWNYVSGLIGRPMRGNWATFDLNDNDLWVHWFEKTHNVCDPSGTVSDDSFYACARNEAKQFLSMTDEALDGCPERQDPTLAVICYWDGSFNKYVLSQLERLDG